MEMPTPRAHSVPALPHRQALACAGPRAFPGRERPSGLGAPTPGGPLHAGGFRPRALVPGAGLGERWRRASPAAKGPGSWFLPPRGLCGQEDA